MVLKLNSAKNLKNKTQKRRSLKLMGLSQRILLIKLDKKSKNLKKLQMRKKKNKRLKKTQKKMNLKRSLPKKLVKEIRKVKILLIKLLI